VFSLFSYEHSIFGSNKADTKRINNITILKEISQEWIVTEFVRRRCNSVPGEEEMLGDQMVFSPSVVLGTGCQNLCLDSQEEREKRDEEEQQKQQEEIY
jgi:hypothetical protein